MPIRETAVAGRFYPGSPRTLAQEVASLLGNPVDPPPARAVVAPHAGYAFSGKIAGETYARARVPSRAVVIGPNHTGQGSPRAIWDSGAWRLPGTEVPVDEELARDILARTRLDPDPVAHLREHSIEVQLPFLHFRNRALSIVPICLASSLSLNECLSLGRGLAEAIRERQDVLLVASTDMSHYLPAEQAAALDQLALARVEALDPEGLYEVVVERDISMCGFVPTTVVLAAARELGATAAERVRYGHSGEASGDNGRVVGYAGLVIR